MPQMSPMNWLMIMMTSSMVMLFMKSINYTSKMYMKNKNNNLKKFMINWKW